MKWSCCVCGALAAPTCKCGFSAGRSIALCADPVGQWLLLALICHWQCLSRSTAFQIDQEVSRLLP
jgi:hypothetical protein